MLADDVAVGAVCALGDQPAQLPPERLAAMRALSAVPAKLVDARRTATRLAQALVEVEHARAAESRTREHFRTVFAGAPQGLVLMTVDGTPLEANTSSRAWSGGPARSCWGTRRLR